MNVGKLNQRISLEKFVPDASASNQKNKGHYEPAFKVWAEVKITQSAIRDSDGVLYYETIGKFYIRRRNDIQPDMRIIWGNRIFELTGPPIDWVTENAGLTLQAREVT